ETSGSPALRALLNRLHEVRQPIHEDIAERRQVWHAAEDFAREYRERGRRIAPERIAAWRIQLRNDLEQLGVLQPGDSGLELREAEQQRDAMAVGLAERLYKTDFKKLPVQAEECIALLLCERRLSVQAATLLTLYTASKRQYDLGQPGTHQ